MLRTIVVLVLIAVFIFIFKSGVVGMALFIGCPIVLGGVWNGVHKKTKKLLADNIVGVVVKETFGDSAEYDPDGSVTPGPMANLLRNLCCDKKTVVECFAVHRDISFNMGFAFSRNCREEHLAGERFSKVTDEPLSPEKCCTVPITVIFHFLIPQHKVAQFHIQTMLDRFDMIYAARFVIGERVFCLFTPHRMESILEMADKANGPVYMAFLRDGTVHIAVNNNRDIFELDDTNADHDALHQKFLNELKWFTDMIDTLRLENTLYQKEANV